MINGNYVRSKSGGEKEVYVLIVHFLLSNVSKAIPPGISDLDYLLIHLYLKLV
jgi:hypothetical protein